MKIEIDKGSNENLAPLDKIYAWMSKDKSGLCGIIGYATEEGPWIPMVGGDLKNMDSWHSVVEEVKKYDPSKTYGLYEFSNRKLIKEA